MPSSTSIVPAAFIVASGFLLAGGRADAQTRTFDEPLHEGLPIDYCGASPASCGEAIAAAWCEEQGFDTATDWSARAGTGAASRSVRFDDGAVCEGTLCESFATITCLGQQATFMAPRLGAAGRAAVVAPGAQTTEVAIDQAELELLMPGCSQRVSGVFVCDSIIEHEHCRTLMISRMVYSCRIEAPFAGEPVEPHAAAPEEYRLQVDSSAEVRVTRGSRGFGRIRGRAAVELAYPWPAGTGDIVCVARRIRIYAMTGPDGGSSELGEPAPCEEPMEFRFEPHKDDLLRAYDLCDAFAAWGDGLEDSIDVLAAVMFEVRPSAAAGSSSGGRSASVAPFVIVTAPLAIDCRD
jgi:hypothetical protein